ncbi:MAG TPA: thioredoxin domain-containing protein [Pyrinomonadaceae bacterium]|jgi:protein-disulfide isomerase
MLHAGAGRPQSGRTFFIILGLFILGLCAAVIHAQAGDEVVAVVNGREISQSEVDRAIAAQLLPLRQQIYALRETALENLILRALLEGEARKRGISVEQLKREFATAKVEVQQSVVEQEYDANRAAFGAMSEDEAKERLRLGLETEARMGNYRAALAGLRQSSRIELSLPEPRLPAGVVEEGDAPATGGRRAEVVIIEFSDFQCPFCKGSQSTLKKVLQTYGDRVRLVFKHLPLEIHSQSFSSARAAFCAGEQNSFWQYHDALFASDDLSPEKLKRVAADLGLDVAAFTACFESERSRAAVLKDVREAGRLGVNATPTFIVNGSFRQGALGFDDFSAIIARELKNSPPKRPK